MGRGWNRNRYCTKTELPGGQRCVLRFMHLEPCRPRQAQGAPSGFSLTGSPRSRETVDEARHPPLLVFSR